MLRPAPGNPPPSPLGPTRSKSNSLTSTSAVNDAFKRDLDRVVGQDEAAFVLALGSTDLAHAEEENLCEVRQVRFDAAESSGLAKCNEVAIRELQEIEADCSFGCPPFKVEDFSYKCTAVKDFLAAYNACFPPPAPPPPFGKRVRPRRDGPPALPQALTHARARRCSIEAREEGQRCP